MTEHCGPMGEYRETSGIFVRGAVVYVDRCIAPIVRALNREGIYTVASCCGHGKIPGSIVLEDGRELLVLEHELDFETQKKVYAFFRELGLK